jgi:uncharacterized protein (TIGR03083 family)
MDTDHDHDHASLDAADYDGLLHELNHRLIDLGRSLTHDQWLAPSLCEGWRACDVFGHMTYGGSVPLYKAVPRLLLKYRGNLANGSKMESIALANATDQPGLMARFAASCAHPVGFGKIIKVRDLVLDHTIHELDVRRPQGIEGALPPEVLIGSLAAVATATSKLFAPAKVAKGLRLVATDVGWTSGEPGEPTVEGPAEDLLLALGGRRVGLEALTGTGVDELSRRTLPG